jgi:hypothetical protein
MNVSGAGTVSVDVKATLISGIPSGPLSKVCDSSFQLNWSGPLPCSICSVQYPEPEVDPLTGFSSAESSQIAKGRNGRVAFRGIRNPHGECSTVTAAPTFRTGLIIGPQKGDDEFRASFAQPVRMQDGTSHADCVEGLPEAQSNWMCRESSSGTIEVW